jgi:putative component of membrane protein insertase Oxa1/YidC/SpoIIIJ protein YidD
VSLVVPVGTDAVPQYSIRQAEPLAGRHCLRASVVVMGMFIRTAVLTLVVLCCFSQVCCSNEGGSPPESAAVAGSSETWHEFWELPFYWVVRFYQVALGGTRYSTCRMEPSCSQFALMAIQEHPLPIAAVMIGDRLLRCGHDLGFYDTVIMRSGIRYIDPVPSEDRRDRDGDEP